MAIGGSRVESRERYWFEVLQKDLEWGSSDGYMERTGDACKLLIFCFVRFGTSLKIVRGCRQVTLFYSMCMAIAFFWVTTFCIMIGSGNMLTLDAEKFVGSPGPLAVGQSN